MRACQELSVEWNHSYLAVQVGGCRIKSDEARSLLNSMKLMFFVRRKVNSEGGRGDVGVMMR